MFSPTDLCPCQSGKSYDTCCRPFHNGSPPDNALQLMRSRYSAYVLALPDYIVSTTHSACNQYNDDKFSWKRSIAQFCRATTFHQLEILDFQQSGNLATVTFAVHLSQKDAEGAFTEKSYFLKEGSQWLYRACETAPGVVPTLAHEGPLKMLPLAFYGDAVLHREADPIPEVTDEIKQFVEEMIATMDFCDGVGLAAPQVHHSIRLFVIRPPIEVEEGKYAYGEPKAIINPVVTSPSKERWEASEGCLSIPSINCSVERPVEIDLEYTALDGSRVQEHLKGWEARVVLHEYDHINGVLFIDRLSKKERDKLEPYLKRLEARLHRNR